MTGHPLQPSSPPDVPGDFTDVGPRHPSAYLSQLTKVAVTLPDGRIIRGHKPGRSGVSCGEHLLRDQLAEQVRGVTEASLTYGRADVLTASAVYEVEPAGKWRHGVRQALAYSAETGLPPAVALFGEAHRDEVLKIYIKLRDGTPKVTLWWFWVRNWTLITSRRACRDMPDAANAIELLKAARREK